MTSSTAPEAHPTPARAASPLHDRVHHDRAHDDQAHDDRAHHDRAHDHAGPHRHEHPGREHPAHDDDAMADVLDLDAAVLGAWLATATDLVASHRPDARTVVDLGAGTGTGALALARRLPAATVVAVDRSPAMLGRLRAAAAGAAVADRVRTVESDLDATPPDLGVAAGTADVVWAASSLHHLADADRVLRAAHDALRAGGLALVVELDAPRVLPDDLPHAPGLGSRLAAAASTWNRHPDWGPHLERAGFVLDAVHHLTTEGADGRYARTWLGRARTGLADRLAPADVAALDRLLAQHPATLDALPLRTDRTVWVAHRPAHPAGAEPSPTPPPSTTTHDGGAR